MSLRLISPVPWLLWTKEIMLIKWKSCLSDNQTYVHLDRNPLPTVNSSYNRVIERVFFIF